MITDFEETPWNDDMELRLWEYIDGTMAPSDLVIMEKLIAENSLWREKYRELLGAHQQLLQFTELESPSLRFTKNVMEDISKLQIAPAAKEYINKKIIWGIASFFIMAIGGFMVYTLVNVDWSVQNSTANIPTKLSKINFSAVFNTTFVNGFMMLNVVLGLMLLDRYLTTKKSKIAS